jgi:hypothetical protein
MKTFRLFLILFILTALNINCLKGQKYYTIGSPKEVVIKLQGNPSKTEIYSDLDKEVLIFGKSRVTISVLTKKVTSYANNDLNLWVKLKPGENAPKQDFLIEESDLHKVIMLNGTPTSYIEIFDRISIFYGETVLNFNKLNQKMLGSVISNSDNIKMPQK